MIGIFLAAAVAIPSHGVSCEKLKSLPVPDTTITSSETVPAGPFIWPEGAFAPPGTNKNDPEPIPEHCRIKMVLTPSDDSDINVELWLPAHNWNNKFMAVGNGGWAGSISGYGEMKTGLRRGYAIAATDTGHTGITFSGMFALGHPEKIIDFAYRAVHMMAVRSKQLINAYYPSQISYSYFNGCSTGGRQGLMSAQRYPGDFDGIIAGAPANRHIHMHTSSIVQQIYLFRHPEAELTDTKKKLVHDAVMKQCDTLHEGFLNNPHQCSFNFSSLQCKGKEKDDCLTRAQLQTVKLFYDGLKNSKGELIFSGSSISNSMESNLISNVIQSYGAESNPTLNPFMFDTVRILGFQDKDYDWHNFNLDRDLPVIDARAGFIDAVDPDLRAFKAHGGKIILYHGWDDPGISAENTVYYFNSVLDEMGPDQGGWMRLFMVPGMGHCRGGDGPHTFDRVSALEKWREGGVPPARIMGSNPESGLQRPLCPYPQYAKYDGSGDLKDAGNWACTKP